MSRRRLLGFLGGVGAAGTLAACGSSNSAVSGPAGSATTATASHGNGGPPTGGPPTGTDSGVAVAEGEIPEETAGPYPGDGSNGVNVLTDSGIVRSDITRSFGSGSAVARGVPLTIKLRVIDISDDGKPLAGAAVYLWHCDREGRYSLYSDGVTVENYLRGVQEARADGSITFTSIFPAAYAGRWPHIHFEVYPSLAKATKATSKLRTSQLALPRDASMAVYATTGYQASISNLRQTRLRQTTSSVTDTPCSWPRSREASRAAIPPV